MLRKPILLTICTLFMFQAQAQLGGKHTYAFLGLPYSPRTAALGGKMLPIFDNDPTLAIKNPSVLNEEMHNHFNLTFSDYLSDILYGSMAYVRKFDNGFTGFAGMQYVNYGEFIRADEFGTKLGTFTAAEYAFDVAASKKITEHWYAGAGLKFIYSTFEKYSSVGIATDYAISYHVADQLLTASFVINNLGFQISSYSPGNREPLPLDIQLGVSKKLAHMPLRFIIVAHHLNDLDFTYQDPNAEQSLTFDNFDTEEEATVPFSEKVFRHFNFAGEFVFSKNFHVRIGYNHQRRKELQIADRPGLVGYSWGFGLKVSKFHIHYGNAIYHVAGGTNYISITTNFSDFMKKETIDDQLK